MSALTDLFTSLANKFRSKTGKSTTLTPNQMIAEIDTVYSEGQKNPNFSIIEQTNLPVTAASFKQITFPSTGHWLVIAGGLGRVATNNLVNCENEKILPTTSGSNVGALTYNGMGESTASSTLKGPAIYAFKVTAANATVSIIINAMSVAGTEAVLIKYKDL